MSVFDKANDLLKSAKKVATETVGQDNLEKLKKHGKDISEAGVDAVYKTTSKVKTAIENAAPNKTQNSNLGKHPLSSEKEAETKLVTAVCPQCGAGIEIENGIDTFFCKYCGNKIILTNQDANTLKAKTTIKKLEHKEQMADKLLGHLNKRAERKAAERELQQKASKRTIIGCLIVVAICLLFISISTNARQRKSEVEEAKLQSIVEEIESDIKNGNYESALIKTNSLYYSGSYSSVKKKWDNTRKSLVTLIEQKESEAKAAPEKQPINPTPSPSPSTQAKPTPVPTPKPAPIIIGAFTPVTDSTSYDLEWVVVCEEEEQVLLVSKYVITAMPFHRNGESGDTIWEKCSLRKWLNDDFIHSAFSSEERSHIISTEVKSYSRVRQYSTTTDRVFLLNRDEFFLIEGYRSGVKLSNGEKTAFWLRDAEDGGTVKYITDYGLPNGTGDHYYEVMSPNTSCGVRPAMWVDKAFIEQVRSQMTDNLD